MIGKRCRDTVQYVMRSLEFDVGGVVFATIDASVVRRAAVFDAVVVVGDEYGIVDRFDAYKLLGVEARLYPLPANEAPTLVSLLGLLGWIRRQVSEGRRVLVEGAGGQTIIAIAFMMLEGMGLTEAIAEARSRGFELLNPLQLRILTILDALRLSGVDLWGEAEKYRKDAFTGGDAHLSTIVELAIEHYLQLSPFLPISASKLYYALTERDKHPRLTDSERAILEASKALDHTMIGAVRNIAIENLGSFLRVNLGCMLLLREGECWVEANTADPAYRRIASMLGLKGVDYVMASPEEVACLSYASLYPDVCEQT